MPNQPRPASSDPLDIPALLAEADGLLDTSYHATGQDFRAVIHDLRDALVRSQAEVARLTAAQREP